jgi:hypothetical protein
MDFKWLVAPQPSMLTASNAQPNTAKRVLRFTAKYLHKEIFTHRRSIRHLRQGNQSHRITRTYAVLGSVLAATTKSAEGQQRKAKVI